MSTQIKIFPDNGPDQMRIYEWIKNNGGTPHLYDGCAEYNIKTSTDATWRWTHISIEGADKWAGIGDYILNTQKGKFMVFTKEEYNQVKVLLAK